MDRLVIQGKRPLTGSVTVSGAKNAALPCLAASLLSDEQCELHRVPKVRDVTTMQRLLGSLGVSVSQPEESGSSCLLNVRDHSPHEASYHLVRQMRASVCVLGPLVAKRRRARVALPGGCQIGHRPIDIHLKGLAALGADIRIERGDVVVEAPALVGTEIDLSGPRGTTVTGTCNLMAAATLAAGRTVLRNAAREPEVIDFVTLLRSMGARVDFCSETGVAEIVGVESLGGYSHTVIGDRIEAATWAAIAAATHSQLCINGFESEHGAAVCGWLRVTGVPVEESSSGWIIQPSDNLLAQSVSASPYPGIPTDAQAQLTAVLTQANGVSLIKDGVFPERFGYLAELLRLGADVERTSEGAIVRGPRSLVGAEVLASDLRASAALVIAALAAEGETVIRRVYHLDRGYEQLSEKLHQLGASIRREPDTYAF